jgi:hypothetical protein
MSRKLFVAIIGSVILVASATAQTTPTPPPAHAANSQPAPSSPQQKSVVELDLSMDARVPPVATKTEDVDTNLVPITLTNEQIKDLVRKSADHDLENDRKQRDYTYIQRAEMHFLEKDGDVKKTESETTEVMVLYGEQVERTIAKNDQPLPPKDAAKEEKKIQDLIEKRKNESDSDRQKRLAKKDKERDDSRRFVQEIADAFDFTFRGMENVSGHSTYVIDCAPRPATSRVRRNRSISPNSAAASGLTQPSSSS